MLHIFLVVSRSVELNQLSVDDTNSKAQKTKSLVGFWACVSEAGVALSEAGYEYLIQNTEPYL